MLDFAPWGTRDITLADNPLCDTFHLEKLFLPFVDPSKEIEKHERKEILSLN